MFKFAVIILFFAFANIRAQDIIITDHPQSIKECVGNSVVLSVSTYSLSDKTLSFQWFRDNVLIPNENTPVLKFPSLQHHQSGNYHCEISNTENETIKTKTVSIYSLVPTSITKQPEDVFTSLNNEIIKLTFKAHVSGILIDESINNGEFVSIQWYRVIDNINTKLINNETYDGVNSSQLSIYLRALPDTTYYFAEIVGKCGVVRTRIVTIIKNLNLIQLKISDLDACEGNVESIKAHITNTQNHKLEYQWYKDGKPIYYKENMKGIFSDELIFNPIFMIDASRYKLEAKIKEMNYSVFSNEVYVNVGMEPNIICFRADTLRYNTDIYDKEQTRDIVTGWTKDVRLAIYYKKNNLPIIFDIYCNGELVSTKSSLETKWYLNDIYYLNYDVERNDDSKYWIVAHNRCGIKYSDTISVKEQNYCDPYNQKQYLCEKDTMYFQIDYLNLNNNIKLDYFWQYFFGSGFSSEIKVPWLYDDSTLIREKNYLVYKDLQLLAIKSKLIYKFRETLGKTQKGLKIRNRDSIKGWEDVFCCLDVYVNLMPLISREPEPRTINNGVNDTLFNISFINEEPFKQDIYLTIYKMDDLKSEPKVVITAMPSFGLYYYLIKIADLSDDGYYFATAKHDNDCSISSDTVRVTVIPNGSISSVNSLKSNSGLLIQPNPSSDFITIQFSNKGLQSFAESEKVQIFDLLGIEILSVGTGLDLSSQRIDVSHLPTGVYFIRIGAQVEKFVKM